MKSRVGIILNEGAINWNGGINYLRNICRVLAETEKYEPIIICPTSIHDETEKKFTNVEVISDNRTSSELLSGKIRKLIFYLTGHTLYIDSIIKKHKINILTHEMYMAPNRSTSIPVACWIPDFQRHYFPEYFGQKSNRRQNKLDLALLKNSSCIILSSNDAKKDLKRFFGDRYLGKTEVLQFAIPPKDENNKEGSIEKYNVLSYKYYIITNQIWKHKNYDVVVNAMDYIKRTQTTIPFKIVSTGKILDPRDPQYGANLTETIKNKGLSDCFVFTDNIPYQDVKKLQEKSLAVIQPSKFEGWNTSVEECKALGKKIFLSDIAVHKEQSPENGVFFSPDNPEELADILLNYYFQYDKVKEETIQQEASAKYQNKWEKYKQTYISLLDKLK